MRRSGPWRAVGAVASGITVLAVIAGVILWRYPSDTYLLLPDKAHPATGSRTPTRGASTSST
jgi:hypothetical protein